MVNKIHAPGPDREGFRVHVHNQDGKVVIEFGLGVTHLPMPPATARELAYAVYNKWRALDPAGMLFASTKAFSIAVHEGKVLLEFPVEISHLRLSTGEARSFCAALIDASGKLNHGAT